MAKNPETTWKMLNVAFENYQNHIQRKADKFNLDIFDFLHISNFKGGNASITEPEKMINIKAKKYSEILALINEKFADKSLGDLSNDELEKLKKLCLIFVGLPLKKETDIRGVASSYASAILAAYFPKLIPILDRRVINGAGIKAEKTHKVKSNIFKITMLKS